MLIVTIHDAQSKVLSEIIEKQSIPVDKIDQSLAKLGIDTTPGEFFGSRKFMVNGTIDPDVKDKLFQTLRALECRDYVAFQYPEDSGTQVHILYKGLEEQVRKRLAVGICPVALSEVFPDEVGEQQTERIAA